MADTSRELISNMAEVIILFPLLNPFSAALKYDLCDRLPERDS